MNYNYREHDKIRYFSLKHDGEYPSIINSIINKEKINPEKYRKYLEDVEYEKVSILDITSDEYPELLRTRRNPPVCLYFIGNLELIKNLDITEDLKNCADMNSFFRYANWSAYTLETVNISNNTIECKFLIIAESLTTLIERAEKEYANFVDIQKKNNINFYFDLDYVDKYDKNELYGWELEEDDELELY